MRAVALLIVPLMLSACAPDFTQMPTSPAQWEARQQAIERREAERRRLCALMNKDSDRYRRDCNRPGDPD